MLPAQAQEWPSRPIRIIVGTAAGGSPDIVSRLLGEKLCERLGQTITIENNTQGAGAVAQQMVSRAPPDGTTALMMTAGYPPQMALRNLGFHPLDGYSFVTLVCGYPMVYAVAPDSPIKSFGDLLAKAKASPGKLTYSITALGSIYHVLTKWIELESGTDMTPIPYRGTSLALQDVLGGRVDVMVDAATSMFPRIQSGQLRMLAVSSAGRYPLMPEAPTVAESVPGIEFMSWLGLVMPPGTARPIVDRLNSEVHRALKLPDIVAKLAEAGNIPTPSTPEAYRAHVEREIKTWSRVIAAAGIKAGYERWRHDVTRRTLLSAASALAACADCAGACSNMAVAAGADPRRHRGRRQSRHRQPVAGREILRAARPVVRDRKQHPRRRHRRRAAVNKSAPDGQTMVMLTAGYPGRAALHQGLAFDPLDGFSFITNVCGYPFVYSVAPNSPIKSFRDCSIARRPSPTRSPIRSTRRARSIIC